MRSQSAIQFGALELQVQKIADEMTSNKAVVFVQFGDEDIDETLRDAATEIERRRSFVSARTILSEIPEHKSSNGGGGRGVRTLKGKAVREDARKKSTSENLRSDILLLLQPFMDSDWYLQTREKYRGSS